MPRPSDEKLSRALRDAGLEELGKRAEAGEFNDFFGEHATPKIALVSELAGLDLPDGDELADRVARGDFDSGQDEAREWYASPEGRQMRNLMSEMT